MGDISIIISCLPFAMHTLLQWNMSGAEDINVKSKRSRSLNEADDFRKCEESVRQLQPDKPYAFVPLFL